MTVSTSEPILRRLAFPLLFGGALLLAAVWQDRLVPGTVVFVIAGWGVNVIRALATSGAALDISRTTDDKRQKLLVSGVALGMWLLPSLAVATPFLDFAAYPLPMAATLPGAGLTAVSLWLFWRSHADLGQMWSPRLELREGHGLVTGGVYRQMRHPMYTAIFLQAIAQPMLIGNWLAGPSGFVAFFILYATRVGKEEAMMAETFGAEWQDYAARTKRLWP